MSSKRPKQEQEKAQAQEQKQKKEQASENLADVAKNATLYIVATPIGNLRDITLRALDILGSVAVIACESAQRSQKLLSAYGLRPERLLICQAGNEAASAEGIVKLLHKGKSVAYISDAGTPGLNDPGGKLVAAAREADFAVEALPGPSALALLVSLAPFSCKPLSFVGFLSVKEGKKRRELQYWLAQGHCFLVYESPFRIKKTLKALHDIASKRRILLGREMTKKNAQVFSGTSDYVLDQLDAMPAVRGEFSLLVAAIEVET